MVVLISLDQSEISNLVGNHLRAFSGETPYRSTPVRTLLPDYGKRLKQILCIVGRKHVDSSDSTWSEYHS